jgi:hypothetical protein
VRHGRGAEEPSEETDPRREVRASFVEFLGPAHFPPRVIGPGMHDEHQGLLTADGRRIRCLVAIHGTADDWEPLPNLRRILRTIEDASLFLLDGANHLGPLCFPDLLLSLVAPADRRRTPP